MCYPSDLLMPYVTVIWVRTSESKRINTISLCDNSYACHTKRIQKRALDSLPFFRLVTIPRTMRMSDIQGFSQAPFLRSSLFQQQQMYIIDMHYQPFVSQLRNLMIAATLTENSLHNAT